MVLGLSDVDVALLDDRGKVCHLFVGLNANNEASQGPTTYTIPPENAKKYSLSILLMLRHIPTLLP